MGLLTIEQDILRDCGYDPQSTSYSLLSQLGSKIQIAVKHYLGKALIENHFPSNMNSSYSIVVFLNMNDMSKILLHPQTGRSSFVDSIFKTPILNHDLPTSYKEIILPLGDITLLCINLSNHGGEPTCNLVEVLSHLREG